MRISVILFGVLVFSAMIIGLGNFYGDVGLQYGQNTSANMLTRYNQSSYVSGYAGEINNQLNDSNSDLNKFRLSALGELITTSFFTLAKSFYTATTSLTGAITSINSYDEMKVPAWAIGLLVTTVMLIISFAIINAIWRKEF